MCFQNRGLLIFWQFFINFRGNIVIIHFCTFCALASTWILQELVSLGDWQWLECSADIIIVNLASLDTITLDWKMFYLNNFCAWGDVLPDGDPVLLLVEHWQVIVHVDQVHHHLGVDVNERTSSSSLQLYHHHTSVVASFMTASEKDQHRIHRSQISTLAVADWRAPPTSSATT